MTPKNPFAERVVTQTFTEEFLQEFAGIEDKDAEAALERAAVWFERSYNAVAAVGQRERNLGWQVYAIPASDADPDEIQRGLQSMLYWVSAPGNADGD